MYLPTLRMSLRLKKVISNRIFKVEIFWDSVYNDLGWGEDKLTENWLDPVIKNDKSY